LSADQAKLLLNRRRLPIGAEILDGGVHFRVWAPKRKRVDVRIGKDMHALAREPGGDGYFSGVVAGIAAGARYKFVLDGGDAFPDPASRFQPDGPHGDSEVVDVARYRWRDAAWRVPDAPRLVTYELHIGTFTPEGTYAAAADKLRDLASLGITAVELMPLAEFPGRFGWGYDGVDLFAPFHVYGSCDDLRAFVDRAHREGIAVILDVVYNHVGPDGNYLTQFSEHYFSPRHKTEWGDAINYDAEHSAGVREFVLANVRHWIAEYRLDGLRLDATHAIYDDSRTHILTDIGAAARDAAGDRPVIIIAENEPQDVRLVRSAEAGGQELDAVWCDDFHHLALVAATGRREAYFTDYRGTAQEFVSALKHGILFQGQHYSWQQKRRGVPAWDVPPRHMVFYLENHDQVANSRDGRRLHHLTSPGRYRALTTMLLLARQSPLLFQGQEFGSSRPFLYFADHNPALGKLVREGRGKFLSEFPSIADARDAHGLDDPGSVATFERSRIDWSERERHGTHIALHRDLLALRRDDPVLMADATRLEGAVLGEHAFVIRYFGGDADRLLVVNLGADLVLDVAPEPLLGPRDESGWRRVWYSEHPAYGGRGAESPESEDGRWRVPGESATLLASGA
jgi:maltooligosyltrehalose trehalohydrolase